MEVAVIIGTPRWGVGLVKEQRAQGEGGEGGFPWSSRWVCHLAL